MSDNFNPEPIGDNITNFETTGTLNISNPQDTYTWRLPSLSGTAFEEIDNAGYSFFAAATSSTDAPVTISLGVDRDNDGVFDNDELIGSATLDPDGSIELDLISDFDSETTIEEVFDSLLEPGEDYFVEIETQNPNIENQYKIEFTFNPFGSGEITTNDSSYCCGDDEDNKYYFDELSGAIEAGQNGVVAGEIFEIGVASQDFEPVLFVLNDDTNEVIDIAVTSESLEFPGFDDPLNLASLSFTVQAGISYSLSIETTEAGETGEYLIGAV